MNFSRYYSGAFDPNIIFILLNNIFIKGNIYTLDTRILEYRGLEYASTAKLYTVMDIIKGIIKSACFIESVQLGGALWFLRTLFFSIILYGSVDYFILKLDIHNTRWYIQAVCSFVNLFIGWFLSIKGIDLGGISNIFSVYCLIYIGNLMNRFNLITKYKKIGIKKCIFISAICFFTIIYGHKVKLISIVDNEIKNPIYFLVMPLSGWMLIMFISQIIYLNNFISNYIAYISIHSIWIVSSHFLCFKLVNLIGTIIKGEENYLIAAFPVLFRNGIWWLLYVVSGIGGSLLMELIFRNIKERKSGTK